MKKIIIIIISVFIIATLIGCSSSSTTPQNTSQNQNATQNQNTAQGNLTTNKEPTQEELNQKLKEEATKADFIQINGHEDELVNKKVYAEGKISVVDYEKVMDLFPSFLLSQKEGDGYGVYHVTNVLNVPDLKDGDTVKVYGTLKGKDKTGGPKINATIIEKQ